MKSLVILLMTLVFAGNLSFAEDQDDLGAVDSDDSGSSYSTESDSTPSDEQPAASSDDEEPANQGMETLGEDE